MNTNNIPVDFTEWLETKNQKTPTYRSLSLSYRS